jgi:hypothetical protein
MLCRYSNPNSLHCLNKRRLLDFLELAETLLIEQDYEGVYQLAGFHPDYCILGMMEGCFEKLGIVELILRNHLLQQSRAK